MQDINSMISDNVGLVREQLKKLSLINDQDAESFGYEALYNAALTFDASKGFKFSTYATCCIYNALGCHIRNLNKKRQLEVISYNNIAYAEDGIQHEFVDFLDDGSSMEQALIRKELSEAINSAYNLLYSLLTSTKQAAVIKLWHDSGFEMSNTELAARAGVSQPYVNQVINTFRHNLKLRLEDYL